MTVLAVGVDVGSVRRRGGFSWASANGTSHGQDDPSKLSAFLVEALNTGRPVAVALECPLTVPVPAPGGDGWQNLGRARTGERNRSWSAGAGTGALATGLVQLAWLCGDIAKHAASPPATTTQPALFRGGCAQFLIAEAMVTADGKPEPVNGLQDHADAVAAARRLDELLSAPVSGVEPEVCCAPAGALNLAAAAALHADLPIDPAELRLEVLVAKTKPVIRR